MARVYERFGPWVLPRELEDKSLENTPQYDLYEDETQNKQTFSQLMEELEPMPEVGDHYMVFDGCKVTEATPNVITKSLYTQCDADGNK